MKTVGVLGASGLVGAALVERLLAEGSYHVRPLTHSSGNAQRLARRGLQLHSVDLLDRASVLEAITGCFYVVNCSRGSEDVMFQGLRNLLRACIKSGVQRLVHLSSTAVYGELPKPESTRENALPDVLPGSYGAMKLRQDEMVLSACRHGLPCTILCPPNISGPYSVYLLMLIESIRNGNFALLESGESPCNLVDVQNLAEAIVLALTNGRADGTRIFVTDGETATWRQLAETLAPLAGQSPPLPSVSRNEVRTTVTERSERRLSPLRSVKHLLSSDVRSTLRGDPLFSEVERLARIGLRRLPKSIVSRVESMARGKTRISMTEERMPYDMRFMQHQLRCVTHECTRAQIELGYRPICTFAQSMESFRLWYETLYGWGSNAWPLLTLL